MFSGGATVVPEEKTYDVTGVCCAPTATTDLLCVTAAVAPSSATRSTPGTLFKGYVYDVCAAGGARVTLSLCYWLISVEARLREMLIFVRVP